MLSSQDNMAMLMMWCDIAGALPYEYLCASLLYTRHNVKKNSTSLLHCITFYLFFTLFIITTQLSQENVVADLLVVRTVVVLVLEKRKICLFTFCGNDGVSEWMKKRNRKAVRVTVSDCVCAWSLIRNISFLSLFSLNTVNNWHVQKRKHLTHGNVSRGICVGKEETEVEKERVKEKMKLFIIIFALKRNKRFATYYSGESD